LKKYARLEGGAEGKREAEAGDSERLAGVKAQSDADDEREVRRAQKAERAARAKTRRHSKAKSEDARKRREARAKTRRHRKQATSARAKRAAPTARSAWNDPWRSQWQWQGQYGRSYWSWHGQTSSWGRSR
jgi:hypothetical protein